MRPKLHKHLFKHLLWREGAEGLFDGDLFWMEGAKDMEGFGASFAFKYIRGLGTVMPQNGGHIIHPYDTVLAFVALDTADILDLGGTVSIEMGEEREVYEFNESHIINIPKGVQYGNVKITEFKHDFAVFAIYLAPEYAAAYIQESELSEPLNDSMIYADYVRLYAWCVDEEGNPLHGSSAAKDGNASVRKTDSRGVMHSAEQESPTGLGPGNSDRLLWKFGEEMLGLELNTFWGHCSRCGLWHRGGEHHIHPAEEILLVFSLDADDPLNLGAEMEESMGSEDERYAANVPAVWICPKDFPHLPQITRWVDRPFAFAAISLDKEHFARWIDDEGKQASFN